MSNEPSESVIETTKAAENPVVTTTEGKHIVVTPADMSPTAPIGAFFSTRNTGGPVMATGKWVTIFAIVTQLIQVAWPYVQQIMQAINDAGTAS